MNRHRKLSYIYGTSGNEGVHDTQIYSPSPLVRVHHERILFQTPPVVAATSRQSSLSLGCRKQAPHNPSINPHHALSSLNEHELQ
jgi:hypothetical protein